jgi:cytochrome oxidase Cu insertion factor (SCO1/SenC/PrrC family)
MSHRATAPWLAGLLLTVAGFAGTADGQTPSPQATPQATPQPAPQYSATLKVGDQAPAFTLPGSDGKTHSLADYQGKTVVLAWFPKAFTGG